MRRLRAFIALAAIATLGLTGTASAAQARSQPMEPATALTGTYTVYDVKASHISKDGRLVTIKVSYSCPAGRDVLVQGTLNQLHFVNNGVEGVGSFGAIDQQATCTGHRQHTSLAVPGPIFGGVFVPTEDVRAFGFLREIPTSDAQHEGGPFVQDIR